MVNIRNKGDVGSMKQVQSKKEGKDQETKQSSTTLGPRYQ